MGYLSLLYLLTYLFVQVLRSVNYIGADSARLLGLQVHYWPSEPLQLIQIGWRTWLFSCSPGESPSFSMPPAPVAGSDIMFSARLSSFPSVNTYYAWCDISLLTEGISVILARNIYDVSGIAENVFRLGCQRSKSWLDQLPNQSIGLRFDDVALTLTFWNCCDSFVLTVFLETRLSAKITILSVTILS